MTFWKGLTNGDWLAPTRSHSRTPASTGAATLARAIAGTQPGRAAQGTDEDPGAGASTSLELRSGAKAPDYAHHLTGWRAFDLDTDTLDLKAVVKQTRYPAQKALKAQCMGGIGHEAPQMHCSCGIYATTNLADIQAPGGSFVYGQVALWGRVCEYTTGYRAQYAYPTKLILAAGPGREKQAPAWARKISAKYGVPCTVETEDEKAARYAGGGSSRMPNLFAMHAAMRRRC